MHRGLLARCSTVIQSRCSCFADWAGVNNIHHLAGARKETLLCFFSCLWGGEEFHGTVVDGHSEGKRTVDTAVLMEIENLRRERLAGLREKFREVFHEETQCRHREHLFRRIAWRLQALAEGDLSERARGRAIEIARDA